MTKPSPEEMPFTKEQIIAYIEELQSGYGDDCPSGIVYGKKDAIEWVINVSTENTKKIIKYIQAERQRTMPSREEFIEWLTKATGQDVSDHGKGVRYVAIEAYDWIESRMK